MFGLAEDWNKQVEAQSGKQQFCFTFCMGQMMIGYEQTLICKLYTAVMLQLISNPQFAYYDCWMLFVFEA